MLVSGLLSLVGFATLVFVVALVVGLFVVMDALLLASLVVVSVLTDVWVLVVVESTTSDCFLLAD